MLVARTIVEMQLAVNNGRTVTSFAHRDYHCLRMEDYGGREGPGSAASGSNNNN